MPGITITKHIAAPPERVFARMTDLRKAPEFISKIKRLEVMTEGPIRVGTRFRETRVMFGREATEEMEVTELDPPNGYALGCESHGCRYRIEFRLTPSGDGTEVQMRFEAVPLTLVAKVLCVLFRPMMKSMTKECAKDLDDIAAAVEGRPSPGQTRSRTA